MEHDSGIKYTHILPAVHINDGPIYYYDRWINETLYMSDSTQAVEMMVTDPKVYEEVC